MAIDKVVFKPHLLQSPTYKGGKAVNEIKATTNKIYKLSSNENPIGAAPFALEALQQSANNLHIYPDRTAIRLRTALESFYTKELLTEQFVVANSGSEIIELIGRAFLEKGLECIVSSPFFMPYSMFSGWQGAKVVDVPLLLPDYSLDVEGILNSVNDNTRLIFLTSPNNPTGTYIPKQQITTLLNRLPNHVILVLDEVYYHFAQAGDFTTALPFVKTGKNIIGINSFSKTFGLAALRIGYAYTTPELAGYIRRLIRPFLINTLCLNAGIAALKDTIFIQKTVKLVQTEKQRLYPILDAIGIHYWKSQSNFILFRPTIDAALFVEKMQTHGIMTRNVSGWGAKGCVRISIGTQAANDAMIDALRKVV